MTDPGSGSPQWNQPEQPNPYGPPPATTPPGAYPPPPSYSGSPAEQTYPQYGQPMYGQPQYGQPPYPPQYGPAVGATPPPPGGNGRTSWLIGSGVAAALVIAAVALFLTVGKSGGSSGSPTAAVKAFMSAAQSGNTGALTKALCPQDQALVTAVGSTQFAGDDRVTSYDIGAVTPVDASHATVAVRAATQSDPSPDSTDLPVEKINRDWKVCISSAIGGSALGLPSSIPSGLLSSLASLIPSNLPTTLPTSLPSDLPTSLGALCVKQTSSILVAVTYATLASNSGDAASAQACVYQSSVPISTTQKLSGKSLLPSGAPTADGTLTFTGTDGTKATIKITKESDGYYYVTSVTIG